MTVTHKLPEYAPKADKAWFALDYDDTYTKCASLFDAFVKALIGDGHRVYFVTFRGEDKFAEIKDAADRLSIPAIATCGKPKREAVESIGVFIDIWIDDWPDLIV